MAQKDAKVNIGLAENSAIIAKASQEDNSAMRMLASASKEDSAAMRIIAAESKKDSSAMKTISILGMIFLPGTFVAVSCSFP
jgi:Mg2+ and Co2+ transporter CorA